MLSSKYVKLTLIRITHFDEPGAQIYADVYNRSPFLLERRLYFHNTTFIYGCTVFHGHLYIVLERTNLRAGTITAWLKGNHRFHNYIFNDNFFWLYLSQEDNLVQ